MPPLTRTMSAMKVEKVSQPSGITMGAGSLIETWGETWGET